MTTPATPPARLTDAELTALRPLQRQFPTLDAVLAEVARLSADLTLPRGSVHVISDPHGDDIKLRHVINNASGLLRPLIEKTFTGRLSPAELQEFLTLVFYPRETLEQLAPKLATLEDQRTFCRRTLRSLFELLRLLARRYSLQRACQVCPPGYRDLFLELLVEPSAERGPAYPEAMIDALVNHDHALHVVHLTVRAVRNLAVDELILAGDCWDRGARGDRVVEYLQKQPNVSFIWGNHDAAWLGACLGLSQLEEGYGVMMQPLERLVREVYANDPATCFMPKGTGLRDTVTVARMQKAAAIMQFKLEGQMIDRNPSWGLASRKLLHTIDLQAGTIGVDGKTYPLRDTQLPTFDPAHPYELSKEERQCLDRIKQSFRVSQKLWEQMKYLLEIGSMYLIRDDHLIFHGCVPVDAQGAFLPLEVDGQLHKGKALFEAFDGVLARSLSQPTERDRDLMWYLWCGPLSPLFGKDRITTLENDLIADPATHVETKNPYFQLIHEVPFCDRIMEEFGVDPRRGLIVNGHVPVKVEKGESPVKRSGKAITIDGAFSQAYGDHGFTLVLEPDRTLLAKHHHFDSVWAAVHDGVDIIPTWTVVRQEATLRRVADTESGQEIRRTIALLEHLAQAYRGNQLRQG
jgi:fructose-1,6-bisphosphatase-3